jgi:hypothetical protein
MANRDRQKNRKGARTGTTATPRPATTPASPAPVARTPAARASADKAYAASTPAAAAPAPPAASEPIWMRLAFQALFAAVVAIALYANTIGHDYAFDDGVVIRENAHVQRGFAGIGAIMTRDAFDSYFKQMSVDSAQLSGGRYRPLSIVTFAVEQGLFGDNAHMRHLINVLLYGLTGALLLILLRTQLLRDASWALLATLLFVVHPIHTEAVANIKGRDELLSFLFIVLTLLFALRHDAGRRRRDLVFALGAYLLALLSKEYGLALLVLLPLALYLRHDRRRVRSVAANRSLCRRGDRVRGAPAECDRLPHGGAK